MCYYSDTITDFLDKRNAVDTLHQGFSEKIDLAHSGGIQQQAMEFNKNTNRAAK